MSGAIAMGTSKITGLGDGSAAQDAVAFNQLKTSNIVANATGSGAGAGIIGERAESVVGDTNSTTDGSYKDFTSLSLGAGVWAITLLGSWTVPTGTTGISMGINTTTGNSGTGLVDGSNVLQFPGVVSATYNNFMCIPNYVVQPSATTTYYAKLRSTSSSGTPSCAGRMTAIRIF
jgi:hypothetical protein